MTSPFCGLRTSIRHQPTGADGKCQRLSRVSGRVWETNVSSRTLQFNHQSRETRDKTPRRGSPETPPPVGRGTQEARASDRPGLTPPDSIRLLARAKGKV